MIATAVPAYFWTVPTEPRPTRNPANARNIAPDPSEPESRIPAVAPVDRPPRVALWPKRDVPLFACPHGHGARAQPGGCIGGGGGFVERLAWSGSDLDRADHARGHGPRRSAGTTAAPNPCASARSRPTQTAKRVCARTTSRLSR